MARAQTAAPPARRTSRWRWLLPAVVTLVWLVFGGMAGPFAGKLSEVAENDNASFLPASAESTEVADLQPLLLVLTVVLSFAATVGVSALVFNHLFDWPGADPAAPLFAFVFLVALGIDDNIFLMTRVREESLRSGTSRGILRGLAVTGGVITSAGLVLAATFSALGVIPILFLGQIAFLVAFGVLLDTFVVRSLLVPALSYELGARVWWPGRLRD